MADIQTGHKPFIQLTDVPPSYATFGTNRVVVNPGETGLIFVPDTFLEEQDTPNSYVGQTLRIVRVNVGETGLEFAALNTVLSFLDLTDTPNSYAGASSKYVKVNPAANALEFVYFPIRSTLGNAILTVNDFTVLMNATGGNRTATLPDASTVTGIVYNIKKIDDTANIITISSVAGVIDGAGSYILTVFTQAVTVQSDGTNWQII